MICHVARHTKAYAHFLTISSPSALFFPCRRVGGLEGAAILAVFEAVDAVFRWKSLLDLEKNDASGWMGLGRHAGVILGRSGRA